MTQKSLSTIEKLPIRDVWPDEARDFTPWLAEHITELGEALGISLETEEKESPVGGRSLDILATDATNGRPVIIENQLEYSDGDHLSRILIYAAGKDADVVVWIAKEFEEEHWLVLQWLNQRTEATTKFFGVAIEVWSIDDSPPAPHFRVVAAPNDWRKQNISERRSAAPREMGKKYYGFRSSLRDKFDGETDVPKVRKTENSNPWLVLASADGLRYAVDFRNKIYVTLQMDTSGTDNRLNLEQCHAVFDRLEEDRETFESALGPLEWKREWGRERGSQIASHYPEKFQDAPDSWDEIHSWIITTYRKFREAFEPYRQELRRIAAEASGSQE